MSQAKVDKYKAEKAVRKQTIAKNKVKRVCGIVAAWLVVVAVVAWIGVSGYKSYKASLPIETHYVNGDALTDFYEYVDGEDTETEDTEKGTEKESTESTESEDK